MLFQSVFWAVGFPTAHIIPGGRGCRRREGGRSVASVAALGKPNTKVGTPADPAHVCNENDAFDGAARTPTLPSTSSVVGG